MMGRDQVHKSIEYILFKITGRNSNTQAKTITSAQKSSKSPQKLVGPLPQLDIH